ncbi:protein Spindly-B isoform X1 [Hyalella azteca]|uniref:Protein Spindly-B isoform X1 n=1 Tax=Hyalella azteca TaxID=294128 RepID=A0A8B7P8D8_HYAAZ|nr:protein Spindly-B isoform X1 [Hyalella azteca]XP_018022240.1 protein Spindly-B isoform X1 [Hyalella azteca]
MDDTIPSKELFNLKKKYSFVENQLVSSEQSNDALQHQIENLQAQLKEKTRENEILQQQNYSIGLKLSSTEQTLEFCTAELENAHDQLSKQAAKIATELSSQHNSVVAALKKEICLLEERQEAAEVTEKQLNEQLALAQQQLGELKEALTQAADVSCTRDDTDVLNQIAALTCEKQELQQLLTSLSGERERSEQQLLTAQQSLLLLQQQLEQKECQLTSQSNHVERLKNEILELQQELELCKMNEKDPAAKGNSLFAEVVDQRQYLEQQYNKLQANYAIANKQYKLKCQQVTQLKLQVATLLASSSRGQEGEYVSHLNESLATAKAHISALQRQLAEMSDRLDAQRDRPLVINCQPGGCATRSTFYQRTLEANKKELMAAQQSLREQQFQSVVQSDKMLQLQHKLHAAENNAAVARAECIKLSIQLHDLQAIRGIYAERDVNEMKIEKLPGHVDFPTPKTSEPSTPVRNCAASTPTINSAISTPAITCAASTPTINSAISTPAITCAASTPTINSAISTPAITCATSTPAINCVTAQSLPSPRVQENHPQEKAYLESQAAGETDDRNVATLGTEFARVDSDKITPDHVLVDAKNRGHHHLQCQNLTPDVSSVQEKRENRSSNASLKPVHQIPRSHNLQEPLEITISKTSSVKSASPECPAADRLSPGSRTIPVSTTSSYNCKNSTSYSTTCVSEREINDSVQNAGTIEAKHDNEERITVDAKCAVIAFDATTNHDVERQKEISARSHVVNLRSEALDNCKEAGKENLPPPSDACNVLLSSGQRNKTKKSVRMQETVDVKFSDGQELADLMKKHDGSGEKLRRPVRKMPLKQPQMSDMPLDCKQQ